MAGEETGILQGKLIHLLKFRKPPILKYPNFKMSSGLLSFVSLSDKSKTMFESESEVA